MQGAHGNRRLAAIAAIDMVAYSRLVEQNEADTLARQKVIQKEVIEPLALEFSGRIVKTTGDGALIEFDSAVNAVTWAAAFQRRVDCLEADSEKHKRIAYRVGVNADEVVVDDDDIFGDGVNLAARLEALADPGGILISEGVLRNVEGKVELGFADLGEHFVKNIAQPVRAYRVLLDQNDAGKFVPLPKSAALKRKSKFLSAAFCVSAGIALLVYIFVLSGEKTEVSGLLVVPFEAESPSDQVFADAATENLHLSFERLKQLKMTPYSVAKSYEGIDVNESEVAQVLGVRYVLDGSAKSNNGEIELRVRLRDALASGDRVVWEQDFQGEAHQLLGMLVTVKLKAAGAMEAKLNDIERNILESRPTQNPAAYVAYANGKRLLDSKDFTDIAKALPLFDEAMSMDPQFIDAKLGSAEANFQIWEGSFNTIKFTIDAQAAFLELIEQVLQGDPRNPDATALRVRALLEQLKSDRALALARGSVFKDPTNPVLRLVLGMCLTSEGNYEDAIAEFQEYERLSPRLNSGEKGDLAWNYLRAGDSGRALELLNSIPEQDLREQHHRNLAEANFREGNNEAAQAYMELFLKNNVWLNLNWMKPWFEIYKDPQVFSVFEEAMLGSGLPEWPFSFHEGREADRIAHDELVLLHSDAFNEEHTVGPFGAPYSEERNSDGTIAMNFDWMNGIPLSGTWRIVGDQICRNIPSVHQGRDLCHFLYLDPEKSTDDHRYVAAPWSFGIVNSVFVRTDK
ncbi:tetratricopeptide repeat protein [Ruegeria sp. 2205SS24-7]|uniref:tetratricopeptide repeat protein n=1 Tax=Ruegeria discodermiae TaxID=3064389 RepID=UPI0027408B30|nr:tetratricopeptide repeat protein [Ruegeria sp. 2205SS24-7]MDP5219026.1 tetratricopeptide repeat protein [Ruegeria sp. 2205SS24-7]